MMCCVDGCRETGKDRKYFFEDEPFCNQHYAGYLESLVDGFKEEVDAERAESAYEKYKIELKPLPAPPKSKPKKSSSTFKMKM